MAGLLATAFEIALDDREMTSAFVQSQALALHSVLGIEEATALVEKICSSPTAEGLMYDAIRFMATLPAEGAEMRLWAFAARLERYLRAEV